MAIPELIIEVGPSHVRVARVSFEGGGAYVCSSDFIRIHAFPEGRDGYPYVSLFGFHHEGDYDISSEDYEFLASLPVDIIRAMPPAWSPFSEEGYVEVGLEAISRLMRYEYVGRELEERFPELLRVLSAVEEAQ